MKALGELSPEALDYFFPGLDIGRLPDSECDAGPKFACMMPEAAEVRCGHIPISELAGKAVECMPDSLVDELMEELEKIRRKYGVTIEQIEAVLSYKVKLSRLRITRRKEIILDDFDLREVRMDTLTKAVYLLFLKHPEGIRFKELSDHSAELEKIYKSVTGRTDMDAIRRSIGSLVDPLDNSINEKVSKAKKAFRNVVDDRIARFYYIDGKQGAAKGIALDRSLVVWE